MFKSEERTYQKKKKKKKKKINKYSDTDSKLIIIFYPIHGIIFFIYLYINLLIFFIYYF